MSSLFDDTWTLLLQSQAHIGAGPVVIGDLMVASLNELQEARQLHLRDVENFCQATALYSALD